jgi:hypothetical protein
MRKILVTLLCGALAAAPALGAEEPSACAKESHAEGLLARMRVIREQSDRIEWTTDRVEQRQLMELHIKHLREGMREMRHRKVGPGCRLEMMSSMMEAMIRHDLVMHEAH